MSAALLLSPPYSAGDSRISVLCPVGLKQPKNVVEPLVFLSF